MRRASAPPPMRHPVCRRSRPVRLRRAGCLQRGKRRTRMAVERRSAGPRAFAAASGRRLGRLLVLSGLLGGVLMDRSNPPEAKDGPLGRYRWTSRVLVVLAADPASPTLAEQKCQFDSLPGGWRERNLVLLQALARSS